MLQLILIFFFIITTYFSNKIFNKNAILCKNIDNFNNLYVNNIKKYNYKKLLISNTYEKLNRVFKTKSKPFFFMKKLISNKEYYLTLSKLVDYKINFNKNKFRSKNNTPLIEAVADVISQDLYSASKIEIISKLKIINKNTKLRQKEIRVLKIILGKRLLEFLADTLHELFEISEVIEKTSKIKHIKKYKNQKHVLAQTYGIIKFNQNATLLRLNLKQNYIHDINLFFKELECYKIKLYKTSHYLKIMFN